MLTSRAQDTAGQNGHGCSNMLGCSERFETELTQIVSAAPFEPDRLRDAALSCAHEAKDKGLEVERLIVELGECLRTHPIPHQSYAELRRLMIGWVLAVYFPGAQRAPT